MHEKETPGRIRKYLNKKKSEKLCTLSCKADWEYHLQLLLIIPSQVDL